MIYFITFVIAAIAYSTVDRERDEWTFNFEETTALMTVDIAISPTAETVAEVLEF